jgi:hypothetical protein
MLTHVLVVPWNTIDPDPASLSLLHQTDCGRLSDESCP